MSIQLLIPRREAHTRFIALLSCRIIAPVYQLDLTVLWLLIIRCITVCYVLCCAAQTEDYIENFVTCTAKVHHCLTGKVGRRDISFSIRYYALAA